MLGDLEDEMRLYNKTAASIAEEKSEPSLMDRFRMPHGSTVPQVAAKARSFATAIRELELLDEFEAHGFSADAATDLETMATGLEGGQGEQSGALSKRAGARLAIPKLLKSGKAAVKTLDAIFSIKYKGDPETLGAWASAKHVRKTGGGSCNGDGTTTPTPPTPPA